jgi:hypothetical protein
MGAPTEKGEFSNARELMNELHKTFRYPARLLLGVFFTPFYEMPPGSNPKVGIFPCSTLDNTYSETLKNIDQLGLSELCQSICR